MRPVRFVALSEDGRAFVLADEVGRLLALPVDDRLTSAMTADRAQVRVPEPDPNSVLSPRDIQARIRAGETADEVARLSGVPVDRILRYAGPVLQERAMLAQHARRTKLKGHDRNATLAQVVDARLSQHGVDSEKIAWDAYRRDDGTWRVVATWPSGKASAQAVWELDKARQIVSAHDDMAVYLSVERASPVLGQEIYGRGLAVPRESGRGDLSRGDLARGDTARGGHEPMRPAPDTARRETRPNRPDPVRAGRDALLATLERPLGSDPDAGDTGPRPRALTRARTGGAFDTDPDQPLDAPAVPSLAVLRPRRNAIQEADGTDEKPRKRAPSWDDVLFGSAPARESS
ncbi:MAG TPA: septation protein SepH [Micromonosporaceae bacterium]|nr:septation protein SepH [Micromonosporaceae bacterium]